MIVVIIFGAIPFIIRRPQVGIYIWSWLSYMNPHRFSWGFAYSFPFSMVIGITTIVSTLFSKEKVKFPVMPISILLVVFAIWVSLTTLTALNPDYAFMEWKRTIKILLMTFIMLVVIRNKKELTYLVWSIVISLGFFGIKGGVFVILTGGSYRVWGPPDSFVQDNNALALALIMIIPLMRFLQLQVDNKWLKRIILGCVVLTSFSIIASYSRGAFLAGSAMIIFMIAKSRRKIIFAIGALIVVIGLVVFMPSEWTDRMKTLENVEEDASAMGRINAWWFAYNLALDRPMLGGGFQAFTRTLFNRYAPNPLDFHDAHSIYFEVLGEHGFVGLIIFLLIGIASITTARWIIKNTQNRNDLTWASDLAAMIQVSLIGYAVGGAFLGLAYYDLPYNLMAMLIITRVIVANKLDDNNVTNDIQKHEISHGAREKNLLSR